MELDMCQTVDDRRPEPGIADLARSCQRRMANTRIGITQQVEQMAIEATDADFTQNSGSTLAVVGFLRTLKGQQSLARNENPVDAAAALIALQLPPRRRRSRDDR
jgi:hypothetical protein